LLYNVDNCRDVLEGALIEMFIHKIATKPRQAALCYTHNQHLTPQEQKILMKSFHSKYRADKKIVLPTIEYGLDNDIVIPKFKKGRNI